MKFSKVNQFHSGTGIGDAITGDMLEIQRVLRDAGWKSEIYAEHVAPGLENRVHSVADYHGDPDSLLIVHHSMGFDIWDEIVTLPDRKILRYHNITPAEFLLEPFASYAERGRQQLRDYVHHVELAIGDSEYNRSELVQRGYRYTTALPIFFRPESLLDQSSDPVMFKKLEGTFNLLFVGRVAPNKKQDELVSIFDHYFKVYNQNARLRLVGSTEGMESYADRIRASIEARGLGKVAWLTGKLSAAELSACYRASNVLVCASEHEGFCVPLLEAMASDLPIVAFSAAAVPETLGDAGILLDSKEPELWCEVIEELRRNGEFRRAVLERQRDRLGQFRIDVGATKLLQVIDGLSSSGQPLDNTRPVLQIQGPFETSYSLAAINRNLALALDEEGTFDVSIYCTEGPGDYSPEEKNLADKPRASWLWQKSKMLTGAPDVVIRNMYPPRVHDVPGKANFLYFFWEDSLIAANWATNFNNSLDGVFVPSHHVQKVLGDSGVSIPLHLLPPGVEENFFESGRAGASPVNGRDFRFLHVSSGFPRKGIDALLSAFLTEFTVSDDVALIIKTFPNIHNDVAEQIARWRSLTPAARRCVHIDEDIASDQLEQLYVSADCMVHPSRGEGFGLPIAEAMARKIPVIVTAYGGHMDFCTEDSAFLVRYEVVPSRSHLSVPGAKWAEPDVFALRKHMRFVFENRDSQVVKHKIEAAYRVISENFRWRLTAQHCAQIAVETLRTKSTSPLRVAMVTSWDARCGIAEYSRYFIEAVQSKHAGVEFEVLSSPGEGIWRNSPVPQIECWRQRPDSDLAQVRKHVLTNAVDVIHFQFNFGFFELSDLATTIRQLKRAGKKVIVTFHATADLQQNGHRISLSQISEELLLTDALLVHSRQEEERFAGFGLRDNVRLIPHGNVVFPVESTLLRKDLGIPFQPVVGTFGFLLPHKGILELLEALKILREELPAIGLIAQCALHRDGISREFEAVVRRRIEVLGLTSCVLLSTDFLSPEEAALFLQLSDLVVLPYKKTQESCSGAVRFALASGRPVITTGLGIFGDVSEATYQLESHDPETLANGIRTLLRDQTVASEFTRRALEHAHSTSWARVGEYYVELLDAIVSDKDLPNFRVCERSRAAGSDTAQPDERASQSTLRARCTVGVDQWPPQLNELTNPEKWDDPEWSEIHTELETYAVDKHCFSKTKEFAYRKGWEWTQALYGLKLLGLIRPDAKALGVGAGHEPLLFYLADRIQSVTGTDLYGNPDWSHEGGREADGALLTDATKFCPRAFDASRLRVMSMDGMHLHFEDETFDFVWSLSAIEHFGGHEAAKRSIQEMARVAKVGGVVVIGTELVVNEIDREHTEYFTRNSFEQFILSASPRLEPIQPMAYRLPAAIYFRDRVRVGTEDVHRTRHHIILDDGIYQWTSAIVFFRKIS